MSDITREILIVISLSFGLFGVTRTYFGSTGFAAWIVMVAATIISIIL